MIPLAWHEIAALELGRLEGDGDAVTAVKADSRDVGSGELFVALNTGIRYVEEAHSRGAATLVPDDQEVALATLAALVRSRSGAQVVAVVGSVGKTTTKDILGALCAPHVSTIWAERSMNNEIGLPLTVCRLEPETGVLVTEMGMRGIGQVAVLCVVARPTVVVVPHVGPEHLELLGSVDRVAEANAEAIAALPAGGVAVVPAAGPLDPYLVRDDITIRRFEAGDVQQLDAVTRFSVGNATIDRVSEGVPGIVLSPWRGDEIPLPGGGFIVNDAYNANPDSMRAALEHLAERAGERRKLAILGEMAELGENAPAYHLAIGELAGGLGVAVIGVGEASRAYEPVAWAADAEAAVEEARALIGPGDAVLVKASRAVGLEGIADEITNFARAWSLSS